MVVATTNRLLTQGTAVGPLCLRICGTARAGQVVQLAAPKCTVGSAVGCTLRLRCAGVRPVECVILRGEQGTAVRSWGPAARLNGQKFGDALIAPGDRLTIGPIELEVLGGA
ncbi:MAG TPA: FHA domain-containing protein [Pirellulales bacterium]|nr:FHA domain-containing protein [Pirellulales bacterium]